MSMNDFIHSKSNDFHFIISSTNFEIKISYKKSQIKQAI